MSGKNSKKSNIAPSTQLLSSKKKGTTMDSYVVKEGTETGNLKNQSSLKIVSKKAEKIKKTENKLSSLISHSGDSGGESWSDKAQKSGND